LRGTSKGGKSRGEVEYSEREATPERGRREEPSTKLQKASYANSQAHHETDGNRGGNVPPKKNRKEKRGAKRGRWAPKQVGL